MTNNELLRWFEDWFEMSRDYGEVNKEDEEAYATIRTLIDQQGQQGEGVTDEFMKWFNRLYRDIAYGPFVATKKDLGMFMRLKSLLSRRVTEGEIDNAFDKFAYPVHTLQAWFLDRKRFKDALKHLGIVTGEVNK